MNILEDIALDIMYFDASILCLGKVRVFGKHAAKDEKGNLVSV